MQLHQLGSRKVWQHLSPTISHSFIFWATLSDAQGLFLAALRNTTRSVQGPGPGTRMPRIKSK